eukprot:3226105-Amphidinium_carterae.1
MSVTWQGKAYLKSSTILPILTYDIWALLPNKSAADAWFTLIIRLVYSGMKGHKDRWLLSAQHPHHMDLLEIDVHQLEKDALMDAVDESMEVLFDMTPAMVFTSL